MNEGPQAGRPLPGSERSPAPGATRGAPADPHEQITVTVRIRRRPGAPPLPDLDQLSARPAGSPPLVTREEFADRYGAAPADVDRIRRFAAGHGLTVEDANLARRTVLLSGTVAQMSRAFGITLYRYDAPDGGYRGREGAVQLPEDLHGVVEGVFGLDNRRMARPASARMTDAASPAQGVTGLTPPQVAALYNFPAGPATGQAIGLIEFGGGYAPDDITVFFNRLGRPAPSLVSVGVDGAANSPGSDPNADGEVALDIDVAGSVAAGADIAVYFAPWTEQGWIDIITTAVHDTVNRPSVLSISWGWPENQTAGALTWTSAAISAVGVTFQEAAALGVTVLAASGDTGSDCGIGDGHAHVLYPATDPYVTACGGTRISHVAGSAFTETTWSGSSGSTGGGISDVFPLPGWQQGAGVPGSVNGGHPGRGIPDVAGNADPASGYPIVVKGSVQQTGGTSAVCPLYAGLVALINAAAGGPAGYLNPKLYPLGGSAVFRDIADDASNATNGAPGYQATAGWDACTGLGSIDGQLLATRLAAGGAGSTSQLAEAAPQA
jgi:kumamolisin